MFNVLYKIHKQYLIQKVLLIFYANFVWLLFAKENFQLLDCHTMFNYSISVLYSNRRKKQYVQTTSINMRWINFNFQPNINAEQTLGPQRCFASVETTSLNVRRRHKFCFQSHIFVETISMKADDQRCFNVD